MRILIGTPAFGGMVSTRYMNSVFKLIWSTKAARPHVSFEMQQVAGTRIDVARNTFATEILKRPELTHLLLIDADMGFEPGLIHKMLDEKRPLTAALIPRRQSPLTFIPPDNAVDRNTLTTTGFVRVSHAGTGIMLVERHVIETMRERFPELWAATSRPPYPPGGALQCFAQMKDQDNVILGEDVSFCLRWTQLCGGEIWACATEMIDHVGASTFSGRYSDNLKP